MDFYEKLNAKHWQEDAAMHSEWALDYLLNGQIDKAIKHQKLASAASGFAHASITQGRISSTATPMATKRE